MTAIHFSGLGPAVERVRARSSSFSVRSLLRTSDAVAPALVRFTLAGVMLPHGAQKMLGAFGGGGPAGTIAFFENILHLPAFVAVFSMSTEFFAAWLLLAGVATRLCAFAFGALMLGAIATVHLPYGFFMNWGGTAGGEGSEYGLLVLGMVSALLVAGGGRWSVDRALTRKDGERRN